MKEVTDFEDFTGHTEAMKTVQIRARVSGYLVKVNFEDGAHVHKGDVLFEIDNRPYAADLENKEALVAQSERHLQRLKLDFDRAQSMLSSKAISQEQYDQYRYDYIEAQAALRAIMASRDTAQLNVNFTKVLAPIDGKTSRRLVDPGNLVVADTTPLTTIVTEDPIYGYFDIDEHTLLRIRRLIQEGKLTKEIDSPVRLEVSDETGFPHPGRIDFMDNQVDMQTGTLRLRGEFRNPVVTPRGVAAGSAGPQDNDNGNAGGSGNNAGGSGNGSGSVNFIPSGNGAPPTDSTSHNKSNASSGGHQGRHRLLEPGMFIRVQMPIGEPHQALVIPEVALGTDQGRKYVLVVNAKNQAVHTPVTIGDPYPGERRVVESGLTTSDRVVVSGLLRVTKNNQLVDPKELKPAEKAATSPGKAGAAPAAMPPPMK